PSGQAGAGLGAAARADAPKVAARATVAAAVSAAPRPSGLTGLFILASALEDVVAAGLGGEVGVVAGSGVVLGRCALAGVGGAGCYRRSLPRNPPIKTRQ